MFGRTLDRYVTYKEICSKVKTWCTSSVNPRLHYWNLAMILSNHSFRFHERSLKGFVIVHSKLLFRISTNNQTAEEDRYRNDTIKIHMHCWKIITNYYKRIWYSIDSKQKLCNIAIFLCFLYSTKQKYCMMGVS